MRSSRSGRRIAACLALLWGALAGAACARRAPAPPLRVAHESDVLTLDPFGPPDAATNSVLANLYEPLISFDHDMVLVPKLAASWQTTDPLTWVIRLRPGVLFHDGAPLTSREVREAFERARTDPESGVKGIFASVRAMEERDVSTIALTTTRPDPLLLNRLAQVPVTRRAGAAFVGTGPYRLVRWEKGKALEAEAFSGYWGGAPRIARVVFVTVPSGPGEVEALRSGSVDILRFLPENSVDEVRRLPHVKVAARAGLSSTYLWIDARAKTPRNPFSDARVRRALSLAIDRGAIVKALAGNALPLEQAVPRGIFGHVASLPPLKYDRAQARKLLKEAGYPQGFSVPLAHSPSPTAERVAREVRGMLAEVGVKVTLEEPEWKAMVADWRAARLGFFLVSWRFDNGDAASFLSDCLVTRNAASGFGGWNPGWSNPAFDRLVEESERVVEPAKRLAVYEELARTLAEEMPFVPLYHRLNLFGISDRVTWQPRLDARVLVSEVAFSGQ